MDEVGSNDGYNDTLGAGEMVGYGVISKFRPCSSPKPPNPIPAPVDNATIVVIPTPINIFVPIAVPATAATKLVKVVPAVPAVTPVDAAPANAVDPAATDEDAFDAAFTAICCITCKLYIRRVKTTHTVC